ncbi:Tn3 family transposase [Brevibacillus sp. SKDU10]
MHPPKEEEKSAIIVAIIAMGTNIGFTKIAKTTQKVAYRQMFTAQ